MDEGETSASVKASTPTPTAVKRAKKRVAGDGNLEEALTTFIKEQQQSADHESLLMENYAMRMKNLPADIQGLY